MFQHSSIETGLSWGVNNNNLYIQGQIEISQREIRLVLDQEQFWRTSNGYTFCFCPRPCLIPVWETSPQCTSPKTVIKLWYKSWSIWEVIALHNMSHRKCSKAIIIFPYTCSSFCIMLDLKKWHSFATRHTL